MSVQYKDITTVAPTASLASDAYVYVNNGGTLKQAPLSLFATAGGAAAQKVKSGLTVAIIGDSISTHPQKNVCEIVVGKEDVGVELSSYITKYDVNKTISLDGVTSGYTIIADDIGTELTFKPCSADVGKRLGTPLNYNSITDVWWQVAADVLGFEPIAATWSGSSITSHTAGSAEKAASYAWHDHTIRTLGKRTPGTMERVAPDVVLIYRGTNDLSHSSKVRLTEGYFAPVAWSYPETDLLSDGVTYGFKEGLALTIKKIRETYPKARIALCTCNVFKRNDCDNFPTNNGKFNIPQMNTAIREVADFFGCQTIDLDKCGITFENCYDSGYITDSATTPTHPNASGHALMGQQAVCDLVHKMHICDIEPLVPVEEVPPSGGSVAGDISEYITEGIAINGSTGATFSGSEYFSVLGYPIIGDAIYAIPNGRNYGIFAADGTLLIASGGAGRKDLQITMPTGATRIDICFKYADLAPADVTITKVGESAGSDDSSDSGSGGDSGVVSAYIVDPWACWPDGTESALSGYFAYVDYPVEGGKTYSVPYGRNYFFEDANHEHISGGAGNGAKNLQIICPSNAAYITICFKPSEIAPADAAITLVESADGGSAQIGDVSGELKEGWYVGSTSSAGLAGSGTSTTYFAYTGISVEPATKYNTPYARNTAFYKADGTYISGINPGGSVSATLTTPAETAKMDVTYKYEEIDPSAVTITKA